MELIKLTHDNIDQEHICCAISSNKDVQVMSKKAWLKERLDEGMGTPTSCWTPASRTARQRGKRDL